MGKYWHRLDPEMEAAVAQTIESCPDNTFALFHIRPPHAPFVFAPDGSWEPYSDGGDWRGYANHLGYVDRKIGRLVGRRPAVRTRIC